jgi:hypothetical protein
MKWEECALIGWPMPHVPRKLVLLVRQMDRKFLNKHEEAVKSFVEQFRSFVD